MTKLFKQIDLAGQANSLAQFIPLGDAVDAKNKSGTVLRSFIEGLSGELKRVYDGMNDMSEDYDINATVELISQWESAVGIPDNCFLGTGDIEERRTHVLIKLAKMNVQTAPEFVELAVALGFADAEVIALQETALPPYSVPFVPSSAPSSRFTIVVFGTDVVSGLPPYDVPFTPTANNQSVLSCVFNRVKPANCDVIFINNTSSSMFSPDDAGVLELWLDSSDFSTITKDGADIISGWADKSGNGVSYGITGQPLWIDSQLNGKAVIDFDGSNPDFLEDLGTDAAALFNVPNASNTLFFVSKRDSEDASQDYIFNISTIFSNDGLGVFYSSTSGQIEFFNNVSATTIASTGNTNTDFNIVRCKREGTTQSISINGAAESSNSSAVNVETTTSVTNVGRGQTGLLPLNGQIAEILIYSSPLSDYQVGQVNTYLSNKWGISI